MGLLDQIIANAKNASPTAAYDGELALKERENALSFVPNNLGGVQATPATMRNNSAIPSFNSLQPPQAPQGMSADDKSALALSLAGSFAGMSGNPNTNSIMAGIAGQQANLENRREKQSELERSGLKNASMMAAMREAGVDDNLLAIAKNSPELLKSIMKSYTDFKLNPADDKKFAKKYSTPRIDQTTGKYFVIVSDPNNGTVEQIEVSGAIGLTDEQGLQLKTKEDLRLQDVAYAQEVGREAFGQMEKIQTLVTDLKRARVLLVDENAASGFVEKYLPAFNSATYELRTIANRLGIEVINSATFGALSETELELALSTGFPRNLSPSKTVEWIDEKIRVQNVLKDLLYKKARSLTSGITYSSFVQAHGRKEPEIDALQAAINAKKGVI